MKKTIVIFIIISSLFLFGNSAIARSLYRTYTVIKITEKTIILERKTKNTNVTTGEVIFGKTTTIVIDRGRGPKLKVGDRVR